MKFWHITTRKQLENGKWNKPAQKDTHVRFHLDERPRKAKFTGPRSRSEVTRGGVQTTVGINYLTRTEFLSGVIGEFQEHMVATAAQHCPCSRCHGIAPGKWHMLRVFFLQQQKKDREADYIIILVFSHETRGSAHVDDPISSAHKVMR